MPYVVATLCTALRDFLVTNASGLPVTTTAEWGFAPRYEADELPLGELRLAVSPSGLERERTAKGAIGLTPELTLIVIGRLPEGSETSRVSNTEPLTAVRERVECVEKILELLVPENGTLVLTTSPRFKVVEAKANEVYDRKLLDESRVFRCEITVGMEGTA